MQLHQLKPIHKLKKKKRIGRDGKKGTFSGKGVKGQKSRSGAKFHPQIREWIKRYPKMRGYKNKPKAQSLKRKTVIVNLETLEKKFSSEEKISPQILLKKKIIRKIKGKVPKVKILGKGELTKALVIEDCYISRKAKEKIEKVEGIIKQILNVK